MSFSNHLVLAPLNQCSDQSQQAQDARILELEKALKDEREQNARLRNEVDSLRHTRNSQARQAPSVDVTLNYLRDRPAHQGLGVPIVDPILFIEWCDARGVASNLMLGRRVSPSCTLQDFAQLLQGDIIGMDGPFEGGHMQAFSQRHLEALEMNEFQACSLRRRAYHINPSMIHSYKGMLSAWKQGNFRPINLRSVSYRSNAPTTFFIGCHILVICQMPKRPELARGSRPKKADLGSSMTVQTGNNDCECSLIPAVWCLLMHAEPDLDILDPRVWAGAMTEHMALKYAPANVVTCTSEGRLLYQNSFSIGCIGAFGLDLRLPLTDEMILPHGKGPYEDINYLLELLGSQEAVDAALGLLSKGTIYRKRLQIRSPILLSFMQLPPSAKVHHDVSIIRLKDGINGNMIYLVTEVDVTEAVKAEQRVAKMQGQQRALLKNILPQQVIDVLLEEKAQPPAGSPSVCGNVDWAAEGEADRPTVERATATTLRQGFLSSTTTSNGAVQLSYTDVQRLSTYHEEVSILFADIQGFTAMSQQVHPSQVMLFLNRLFAAFDELTEDCDVYKVKTIGDCYMVCAGLFDRSIPRKSSVGERKSRPSERGSDSILANRLSNRDDEPWLEKIPQKDTLGGKDPYHAHKILRFAKAILVTASHFETPLGEPLKMRVGIHSGSVMSGVVGRKMPRFSCFGDTVNTASRMETLGAAGHIHASAAFRSLTPEEPWVYSGGVDVKGKGLMETYILYYEPSWDDELQSAGLM